MTYREARPGLRRGRVAAARKLGNCGGRGRSGESGFRGVPEGDAVVTSERLGRALDLASRGWWRLVGRRVDLDGGHRWLDAPTCGPGPVGATWLRAEAERLGGFVREDVSGGGLLPSMSVLDGAGFRAAGLDQAVRHFYEHTACWRMDVWAQWSALFQPGGELAGRLFGRRVQQLALPVRPLDVAHGIDSRVVHLMDANGGQRAAGWLRTLSATGEFVYSGCYSARLLPASDQPSVHVAFPLESGNVQVFLRPSAQADGSLVLSSPPGAFGDNGAYVVVRNSREAHAARVPIHERFHVYRDHRGVLRTDHEVRLYRALVMRLHYRMEPA
jgi:hypothetical protein